MNLNNSPAIDKIVFEVFFWFAFLSFKPIAFTVF